MLIRPAVSTDAAAIAQIYAGYVAHTAITFATETPSVAHYAAQIADARYPFFVAEEGECVVGFVYAAPFRTKEAYRWDVELTIYLSPEKAGRGTGSALMTACLDRLTHMGYLNAYSCITVPNERSVGLHRKFGFDLLGAFPKTGYKLGRWHDVVWMGKQLADMPNPPAEPHV